MHSIKLEIKDSVFDKIIYFLQKPLKNEVKIVKNVKNSDEDKSDIKAFSNHSANLIEEWKVPLEDEIWK
jgi:hypothetical protein